MSAPTASRALPRALRRTRWPHAQHSRRTIATAAAVEHHEPEPFVPPPAPTLPAKTDRQQDLRDAKPFSNFLTDTFDRQHDYLRISLTERCNLRCTYCMPEEGIQLSPNKDILTTPEIFYLSALFVNQGVNKIRLTGGEPTVRKDIIPLMQQLGTLRSNGLKEIALTTNGISLHRKLDEMVEAGLTGVNISLDTLDPHLFVILTRRQGYEAVMKSINKVLEMNRLGAGIKLKVNCVAMRGLNDHQILPFVEMTRDQDIEVRFIEYMPFGGNKWAEKKMLPYSEMLDLIRTKYPISRLKGAKNDTSKTWQVPGFKGKVGFITSMTHNFCGTCNRLRITSDGNLKVCLHGNTEVSLRDLLRKDHQGEPMDEAAFDAIRQIELDRRKQNNLRHDGEKGWISKERELLEVIGAAVKRKKAAHAGMGKLESMENRPMILIGENQRVSRPSPKFRTKMIKSSTPAWSHIPLHLLRPLIVTPQARYYSSNHGDDSNGSPPPGDTTKPPADRALSGTGSIFQFQSLSGLFPQSFKARYSRPREHEEPTPPPSPGVIGKDESLLPPSDKGGFFRWNEPNQTTSMTESSDSGRKEESTHAGTFDAKSEDEPPMMWSMGERRNTDFKRLTLHGGTHQETPAVKLERPELGKPGEKKTKKTYRKTSNVEGTKLLRQKAAKAPGSGPTRRPDPFKARRSAPDPIDRADHDYQAAPWGLKNEGQVSVDSAAVPSSSFRSGVIQQFLAAEQPPILESSLAAASDPIPSEEDQPRKSLTHVNSSGEAHMVDVSRKDMTKRIAIAICSVYFSSPEPYKLIIEDKNKKGDVLGVARIAGIMAAKRTSDMIPLCHPIPLTKVRVDLDPIPLTGNHAARVNIQTQVECTGATGVEMEALTAASAAALTIYDMCKAVDKEIKIVSTQLVYKSGGKSGLFVKQAWAQKREEGHFLERGLEVPPSSRKQNDKATTMQVNKPTGLEVPHSMREGSEAKAPIRRLMTDRSPLSEIGEGTVPIRKGLADKLTDDMKAERRDKGLCAYCGGAGHMVAQCPHPNFIKREEFSKDEPLRISKHRAKADSWDWT